MQIVVKITFSDLIFAELLNLMEIFVTILFFLAGFIISFTFLSLVLQDEKLYIKKILENKVKFLKSLFVYRNKPYYLYSFVSGIIGGAISSFFSYEIIFNNSELLIWLKLFIIFSLIFIFLSLLYMSIFDITYFEVPSTFSFFLLCYTVIFNLILMTIYGYNNFIKLWGDNFLNPSQNFLVGIVYGGLILLIVLGSHGKAMGDGDVHFAAIMGLMLGMDKILFGFYVTIFSALFYGLGYAVKIKKFHGVKIPFVPFIALGTLVAFIVNFSFVFVN